MSGLTFDTLKSGEVPLEFGNRDHIQVIDREIKNRELDEKQGEYEVTIHYASSYVTTVRAWDDDEAKELAEDEFLCCSDSGDAKIEDIEIEVIKEPEGESNETP